MPYLGEVMTKTKAVRRWVLRHNLSHLYYACKFGHWKLVRSMLFGGGWVRVKDVKLGSVHPHDARGVPFRMSKEDVDKELASRKESEIDDAWSRHNVDGGDDG